MTEGNDHRRIDTAGYSDSLILNMSSYSLPCFDSVPFAHEVRAKLSLVSSGSSRPVNLIGSKNIGNLQV